MPKRPNLGIRLGLILRLLRNRVRRRPKTVERLVRVVRKRAILVVSSPLVKLKLHPMPRRPNLGIRLGLILQLLLDVIVIFIIPTTLHVFLVVIFHSR